MPRHLAAAHFRVDDDGFQPVAFADAEFRGDDPRLAAHAFPVEQPFHLPAGQIDQNAVVVPDFVQQGVGQPFVPIGEDRLLVVARQ